MTVVLGLISLCLAPGTGHGQQADPTKNDQATPVFPDEPDSSAPAGETDARERSVISHSMDGTQYASDITLMEGVRPLFPLPEKFTELDLTAPISDPLNAPSKNPLLGSPLEMLMDCPAAGSCWVRSAGRRWVR